MLVNEGLEATGFAITTLLLSFTSIIVNLKQKDYVWAVRNIKP